MAMRLRIRDTIEELVHQELDAALSAAKSARVGETRQGYRHGTRQGTLTTSLGPTTIAMPRARVRAADRASGEWRSGTVRRYQRRTTRVVLDMRLDGEERVASWTGVVASLAARHHRLIQPL